MRYGEYVVQLAAWPISIHSSTQPPFILSLFIDFWLGSAYLLDLFVCLAVWLSRIKTRDSLSACFDDFWAYFSQSCEYFRFHSNKDENWHFRRATECAEPIEWWNNDIKTGANILLYGMSIVLLPGRFIWLFSHRQNNTKKTYTSL